MNSLLILMLLALVRDALSTECETLREEALNLGVVGTFIPSCDPDGSYSAMQCHASTGFCYCVLKNGIKITDPARGKYVTCQCFRERFEALKLGVVGTYIPECQDNGKYTKKQCWSSTGSCWCVNELTGKKLNNTNCLS